MKLSYFIFREFAIDNMYYSDGKKISQMIQFVFKSYLDIIKFDITKIEFAKESNLTKRIEL